jgi:hypothetical protein
LQGQQHNYYSRLCALLQEVRPNFFAGEFFYEKIDIEAMKATMGLSEITKDGQLVYKIDLKTALGLAIRILSRRGDLRSKPARRAHQESRGGPHRQQAEGLDHSRR